MPITAETYFEHNGETKTISDHDRDLIHELRKRNDSVCHLDQYIANVQLDKDLKMFWTELKNQEKENVRRLKKIIVGHIKTSCL
ncbi:MAG: hypothetical protein ORN51_06125 [Akkermansiaceae bacterium]|jgi:hypothetical protein|nr:hypothetical protein [Akkermansiaceae bacterium]